VRWRVVVVDWVNPLTTTLLAAYGVQRCGDDADTVNNIPYFLLDPLQ
jgi:hypothetical protein